MKAINTTSTATGRRPATPRLPAPARAPAGFALRRPRTALEQHDRCRGDDEPDRPRRQHRASPELNDPDGDRAEPGLDDAQCQRDGTWGAQPRAQAMGEVVAAPGEQREPGPAPGDRYQRGVEHRHARRAARRRARARRRAWAPSAEPSAPPPPRSRSAGCRRRPGRCARERRGCRAGTRGRRPRGRTRGSRAARRPRSARAPRSPRRSPRRASPPRRPCCRSG